MIIDAFVGNVLRLAQGVASNIHGQTVVSRISLQSTVRANVILQSVDNFLGLHDWATGHRSVTVAHVQDTLNLSSTPSKGPPPQSVVQAIGFWQQIVNTGFQNANSQLNLTQTVSGFTGKWATSNLSLAQSVNVSKVKMLTVTDVMSFGNKQAAYKPSVNFLTFADPILHEPHPYFQLGTDKVILRSPEWGNSEKVQQNRIMRRSRAGDLIIFRDGQWPTMTTLHMDFAYIDPETAHHLLRFMRAYMGQKVKFYDNEQRTWTGYIMTPASQIAEQLRGNYTVTIEFQGIQTPLHVDFLRQTLTLTSTASYNLVTSIVDPLSVIGLTHSTTGGYACSITEDGDGFALVTAAASSVARVTNDGTQFIRIFSRMSRYNKVVTTNPGPDPTTQFTPLKRPSQDPIVWFQDDPNAYFWIEE